MIKDHFIVTECSTTDSGDAGDYSTKIIRAKSIKDVVKYLKKNTLKNPSKRDREIYGLSLWRLQSENEGGMIFVRDTPYYASYTTYKVEIEPLEAHIDLIDGNKTDN